MADKTEKITRRNNKFSIGTVSYSDNATDDLSGIMEIYKQIIVYAVLQKRRLAAINKKINQK